MIDDRNPNFARSFQISTAQLGDLRSKWREMGRQVWDAGTRLGQDIRAQTEQQLEALGRDYLRQTQRQQVQSATRTPAAAMAHKPGDLIRRGGKSAATTLARAAGQVSRSSGFENEMNQRIIERTLGEGTVNDPGPGRIYQEWRTGDGPAVRDLDGKSTFSREFVAAPSVKEHVRRAITDWQTRPGGWSANNGGYTNYAADFGPDEFTKDALARNAASHVIGSFRLDGVRRENKLIWTADN